MAEDLDSTVHQQSPDRWLSSRFVADETARADLIALYALDHELTRIPKIVTDPLMGEIRMTWWIEGLEEIAAGKIVRPHAVLQAISASKLPAEALAALAEARLGDLDEQKTGDALVRHIDATEGLIMALAARRLSNDARAEHVTEAARAYALSRLGDDGATAALTAARAELKGLSVEAFPAVAHATLARPYARNKNPGELEKRTRVLMAVLTGRI